MTGDLVPSFLTLGLAGGIVAADETAVGQVMVSRPIAAGFLAGLFAGNLELGVLVGALFELLYIDVLPVGGAGFPSAGLAAVSGVSVCGFLGWKNLSDVGGFLPFLVLGSALAAAVGGRAVVTVRKANGRLVERAEQALRRGRPGLAQGLLLAGILLSFARGFAVVVLVLAAAAAVRGAVGEASALSRPGPGVLTAPFAALGVAVVLKCFMGRRRSALFLLGAAVAGAVLLLSRW